MDLNLIHIILLILVGLGAGFVQRVSGFGLGIFAMLFLPHFLPSYTAAAAISCLFSCGTSGYNTVKYRKNVPYKTIFPLICASFVTIPIAVCFSSHISKGIFEILLGAVLIILSAYFMFFGKRVSIRPTVVNGIISGALSGVLGGLFSTGGPPVVLYLTHATDSKEKYFASTQFFFFVTNVYATVMRIVEGIVTLEVLVYALIGFFGCMAGDFVGKFFFDKLNPDRLKFVIYIGMLFSGVIMIVF